MMRCRSNYRWESKDKRKKVESDEDRGSGGGVRD